MERFTEDKRQLIEMLKLLIKLYYQLKDRKILTDAAIAALEDFIRGVTGLTFKYDEKGGLSDAPIFPTFENFVTKNEEQVSAPDINNDAGALEVGNYNISATTAQLKSFAQVMELLEKSKKPVHFELSGITDEITTSFNPVGPDSWVNEEMDNINNEQEGKAPEMHWASMEEINKKINAAINDQEAQRFRYQKVEIISNPHRIYTVDPVSEFALALLKAEPKEKPPNQIFPISLVDVKPLEKTINHISLQNVQKDEDIDQLAFLAVIKQNRKAKPTVQMSQQLKNEDSKEEKSDVTPIIEAMNAELRKLPPGHIPPRIMIKSNRQENEQNSLPLKSILVEPIEESSIQSSHQSYIGWTSFVQIARAVLVNFHISFGSYERIKNCLECGKIFFEKKKASGLYCGVKCKSEYNIKLLSPEKRRCMEKQNIWIRREFGNPKYAIETDEFAIDSMKRSDCRKCDKCQKGGHCSVLINKNRLLCKKIEEQSLLHKKKRRNMNK